MIHLLIVDDHAIVRKGLKQIVSLVPDMTVAAEASDGATASKHLNKGGIDLVLLDMSMPGISGDDLISHLHALYPAVPILVLSMHNEPIIVRRAIKAGASGYLSKDCEPEELLAAIRKVANGGRFVDPLIAEQIVFRVSRAVPNHGHEQLTDREFQILRLVAKGLSGNEIAAHLSISNKTVSTHKNKLMEKMGFTSPAELFRYAIDHGLLN
jgi:DNA-binding NarL/FixJ family response regulator